jgi:DNA helicase IV
MTKFPDKYCPSIIAFDSGESYKAINLITAMSSQGISYKCVIVVLDSFESITWFKKQEIINMLYTSVTRPTHELLIVSLEKNEHSKKAADVIDSMKKDGILCC